MNLIFSYHEFVYSIFPHKKLTATAPAKSRMIIRDLAGDDAFSNDIFWIWKHKNYCLRPDAWGLRIWWQQARRLNLSEVWRILSISTTQVTQDGLIAEDRTQQLGYHNSCFELDIQQVVSNFSISLTFSPVVKRSKTGWNIRNSLRGNYNVENCCLTSCIN